MGADVVKTITDAVDFATIITGIGVIAASIMLVLVSVKGAKMLFNMVRGS